jgi:hypothetical protein
LSNDPLEPINLLSTADYIAALDKICGNAMSSLYVFEKDFINCGFNSTSRFELLKSFLLSSPKNQLFLLAHDTRPLSEHCPRLMILLQKFSHNMSIYQTPKNLQRLTEPFAVADQTQYVRRFHFDNSRGVLALGDGAGASLLKSRFMEMWAVSRPNISTSTFSL